MRHPGIEKPLSHQMRPTGSVEFVYMPMDAAWPSPEFPVSDLWVCEPEPESRPVRIMHIHEALEIGYCHRGTGVLIVEDRVIPFAAGDVSIINHAEMHMSRANNNGGALWDYFWFDPAALLAGLPESLEVATQDGLAGPDFPNVISPNDHPEICQTVALMINELRDKRSPGHRTYIRGLAAVLMTLLHRTYKTQAPRDARPQRSGVDRVAAALHHIAKHYIDDIDVDELAMICGLSVTHFRRIFLAAVGMPPLQYLARLRVRMAAGMLREHLRKPITAVASDVGFDSINTFNRQFRQVLGVSPRQWRQQAAKRQPVPPLSRPSIQTRTDTGEVASPSVLPPHPGSPT